MRMMLAVACIFSFIIVGLYGETFNGLLITIIVGVGGFLSVDIMLAGIVDYDEKYDKVN
jgi:hypothetical protein